MAILRTLRIHKYLDVAPSTLTFHPLRNLLLGVNGGGKTTLLNLVSMVLNLDFRALEQVPFAIGFVLDQGEWTMDVEISNEASPQPSITGIRELRAQPFEKSFAPSVRIDFRGSRDQPLGHFETDGQKATFARADAPVLKAQTWRPHALGTFSFVTAAVMTGEWSADIDRVHRFDEGVDFFRWIHAEAESPFVLRHHPGGQGRSLSGLAPEALSVLLFQHQLKLGERLSLDSADQEFLKTFVEASGFDQVRLIADLIERSTTDADGAFEEKFRLTLYCARGDREFIQNDLSFGQMRLWAFLYYLECNRHSVVADELVNGLHHRWIKLCVDRLGDRQAFLTSQNPLLFDFIPLGTPTDPRCTFIRCDLETPKMRWRNLDEDETRRLYDAYEAGIESVGEILQTRGLW